MMEAVKFSKDAIDKVIERLNTFGIVEWSILKICMMSFGMLVGIYTYSTSKKMKPLLWITFLVSYIYLMYKIVFEGFKEAGNKWVFRR